MIDNNKIISELEKKLMTFNGASKTQNVGVVLKNTDGVIVASGLSKAAMGEKVIFKDGNIGTILNLDEDSASIILLGEPSSIKEGDTLKKIANALDAQIVIKLEPKKA